MPSASRKIVVERAEPNKPNRDLLIKVLEAFGAIRVGHGSEALEHQANAIGGVMSQLDDLQAGVLDQYRLAWARETESQRISEGDPQWAAHMTHCYGWDDEGDDGYWGRSRRNSCKYADDDICPAALHEDPLAHWKSRQTG